MFLKKKSLITTIIAVGFICVACVRQNNDEAAWYKNLIPDEIKDTIYLNGNNVYSNSKALLGRYLFYDRRLSLNNTKACASCHAQEFSFTDGYHRSVGALGDLHQRNSKPLINLIFNKYLTAADSAIHFPEQQIDKPLYNTNPVELGVKGNEQDLINKLKSDSGYKKRFAAAFPDDKEPVSMLNIKNSIATFLKTIISFNSPWDNYTRKGDSSALSYSQKRGMQLFFSDRLKCGQCHGGINFATPRLKLANERSSFYFNTGLYNLGGTGAYPLADQGLKETTGELQDMGKYRVPTLRNLFFTAPYFHDGSAATIDEVVTVYEQGGRVITKGPLSGDGRKNQYKNPLISGFSLGQQERMDLINFLHSLSDSSLLKNPSYSNPFKYDEIK